MVQVSKPRNKLPIVIAGGGIGGLACALALAQRDFTVVVCEKSSEFGEFGAGLQVAPNALSVLDALGVSSRVKTKGLLIERMMMKDAISSEIVCDIPCGKEFADRFGNPYAVAHRADVHGSLLDGCRQESDRVALRTASEVTSFVQDGDEISVKLRSGDSIQAGGLIGADGIRSSVREILVGDAEPETAGAIIFRALIPATQMPERHRKAYPTLWAGPGYHIIYYPVSDWTMFNLAITVVADARVHGEGKSPREDVLGLLVDCCEEPLEVVGIPSSFLRYVIRYRNPISNWSNGLVTLLGDAAHAMVQYIAQGAAMALEDAICLADQADRANGDISKAFGGYQNIRISRSARVQLSSLMLHRIYHASGVERVVRNSIFEGRTPCEHYDRFSWLYRAPSYVAHVTTN
jgi:3-hydroxybenzoate 6-monooxygenase